MGPYLLPPLQLTEDSLEALVHVVKLNISHRNYKGRKRGEWFKRQKRIGQYFVSFDGVTCTQLQLFQILSDY